MKIQYKSTVTSLVVAIGISIIVNFSYLLSIWVIRNSNETGNPGMRQNSRSEIMVAGKLTLSADGYGYILAEDSITGATDSIYVPNHKIRRFGLKQGSMVAASAFQPQPHKAHKTINEVKSIDGVEFEYAKLFDRSNDYAVALMQVGFYALFAFIINIILTARMTNRHTLRVYFKRTALCLVVSVGAYLLAPIPDWHSGGITINAAGHQLFNPMILMQCSFTFVVSALYGLTFLLLGQRTEIELQMSELRNETLKAQYAMLVNQINPHFLFNSLNSLSMLVREQNSKDALRYIDRLSYTFRYIIQTDNTTMVSLDKELEFLDAYRYLLEIRYADKLFFDINIDHSKLSYTLPSLSLQPLIENAVKHNSITTANPLTISIRTEGDTLLVENGISPKIEKESSTGIGLRNLTDRWSILAGRKVEITDNGKTFRVALPLTKPRQ